MKLRKRQLEVKGRPATIEAVAAAEEQVVEPRGGMSMQDWERLAAEARVMQTTSRKVILATLCPERRDELGLTEDFFTSMKDAAIRNREFFSRPDISALVDLVMLYPERREELDINDELFQGLTAFYHEEVSRHRNTRELALQIALLFPDKRDQIQGIDDFDDYKEILQSLRNGDIWNQFSFFAYEATLLYPERRHELGITENDLKQIEKMRDESRDINESQFLMYSLHLAILSAKHVDLSVEHGLVLTHKESLGGLPSLPLRKEVA